MKATVRAAQPTPARTYALIAAELTGRVCLSMEIDPRYCDVTIERWQRLTGGTAVLAGEDRVFADVAAARGVRVAA